MRRLLALLIASGCAGHIGVVGVGGGTGGPPPPPAPPPATTTVHASASVTFTFDVQFYSVPLDGANDIVLVLDRSGSLDGGKLEDAKRELAGVIDRLPDGTRVGLVFFNSRVDEFTQATINGGMAMDSVQGSKAAKLVAGIGVAYATKKTGNDRRLVTLSPSYRHYAHRFISKIDAAGSTAAVPALRAASTMGARHIVFLSDGLANTGGDGDDVLALGRNLSYWGIRVDTIGLGRDQDYRVLQQLSAMTGGVATVR